MRPSEALYTKWSDAKDSVWIGGSGNHKVSLLGSNLASSVLLCEHSRMEGFALAISKGKKGVVAVRAFRLDARKGGGVVETNFFVSVDNSGEEPNVDLNEVWVPSASRMGHVNSSGYIVVLIDGERFTTDKAEYTHGKHKDPNAYTVDGNTLVKYLAGDIEAIAVREASKDHVAEISAREKLYEVELENNRLNAELKSAEEDISDLEKGIATLQMDVAGNIESFRVARSEAIHLEASFMRLKENLEQRAFGIARTKPLIKWIDWRLGKTS